MAVDSIRNSATVLKESKHRSKTATKTVGSTNSNNKKRQQKVHSEKTIVSSNNNNPDHSNIHNNNTTTANTNEDHLPPILLTLVVFTCSSIVFILCLRDFWMTGKNILGHEDDMFLVSYTKQLLVLERYEANVFSLVELLNFIPHFIRSHRVCCLLFIYYR